MSKSLSVKVKTSTLVKALEEALDKREKRWANQEKEIARHKKEVEAYNASILKLVKAGKGTIHDITENKWATRNDKNSTTISFSAEIKLPKSVMPVEPKEIDEMREHTYKMETDDISQALRILKMTDQEYVNASTYKSVAEYL